MNTYQELLAEYRVAKARADEARAAWEEQLPAEGVRLSSHPEMRAAYDAVAVATEVESKARTALINYRGE
jgi:hypothetical protein